VLLIFGNPPPLGMQIISANADAGLDWPVRLLMFENTTSGRSCPHEPLVSYRINRQLSGWNPPPLMVRAFGAHCQKPTHALQRMRPPTEAVSQIKKKTMSSATTAMLERRRGGLDHYGS
jgi:hypothetical protein